MLLHQPYPVSERSVRQILLTACLAGAFVALFLIVFQPFGTAEQDFPGKTLFLSGYGLIVAAVIGLSSILPGRMFQPERWTVGRQILLISGTVLVGITASYFYVLLLGGSPSWRSYGFFVVNSMTVAVFPIVGITLADYMVKLNRYRKGAMDFNERPAKVVVPAAPAVPQEKNLVPAAAPPKPAEVPAVVLHLTDDQDRPVTDLPTASIWCLRSDRNYVDVHHLNADGQPVKTTVRNTLTKLSADLPEDFLHCHRSCYVRATAVDSVTGNAQGYQLHHSAFPDCPVPVSRGKSAEVLGFIQG